MPSGSEYLPLTCPSPGNPPTMVRPAQSFPGAQSHTRERHDLSGERGKR